MIWPIGVPHDRQGKTTPASRGDPGGAQCLGWNPALVGIGRVRRGAAQAGSYPDGSCRMCSNVALSAWMSCQRQPLAADPEGWVGGGTVHSSPFIFIVSRGCKRIRAVSCLGEAEKSPDWGTES